MENNIAKIDPNFSISDSFGREDVVLRAARTAPFSIHGVFHDGTCYRRVPKDVAEATSPGVAYLATNAAGGRVRFRTDSPFMAIHLLSRGLGHLQRRLFCRFLLPLT